MKNYFEFKDDKSSKFWEISITNKTVTARYGKIGTPGQISEKTFENDILAQKECNKLIKDKTGKGYVATTNGDNLSSADNKKSTEINRKSTEPIIISFGAAQEKHNISFLPSYVVEQYEHENILIFEEDAHFETLDFDSYAEAKNVNVIIFCKNLSATNWIIQQEMDYGPTIIVLGHLKAKNLWCSGGNIYFKGDVVVEQSFIAGIYNHGELTVSGDIQTELVLSEDHMFDFKTISKGIPVLDSRADYKNLVIYTLKDALAKKYLYDEEYADYDKILKSIKKGESILRTTKPNTPFQAQLEKSSKTGFTKLDLSYLQMQEIPKEVFELENLIELNLGGNVISGLPNDIKKLKKLEKLNIANCYLKSFPEVIFELTQLTSLNIGGNLISKIPEKLSTLHLLKTLKMCDCGTKEFPESIYELENLEILDVSYLKDIGGIIKISKPLKNLKSLNLYSNRGAKILVELPNLQILNLSNCALFAIPEKVFFSSKLKELDLTLNRNLTAFTDKLQLLINLTELSFTSSMPDIAEIQYLSKLKKLVVQFDHEPSKNFEDILLNPNWTELGIEGNIESRPIWRKILSRPTLKKLEIVSSLGNRTMDIEEGRKELKVKI